LTDAQAVAAPPEAPPAAPPVAPPAAPPPPSPPAPPGAGPVDVQVVDPGTTEAPSELEPSHPGDLPPADGGKDPTGCGGEHKPNWVSTVKARRRLIAVAIIVALLSPAAWSYGAALAAPGNNSFAIRSVEWIRDHHGRWLVNDIENFWYTHHKPKKGGVPKIAFPTGNPGATVPGGQAPAAPAPASAGPASSTPAPRHLPAPAPIPPIVASPLPGEGQWVPLGQAVDGVPAMYAAYLRPDAVYTSVVTGVAWMDPTLVKAVLYAGVQEPGGGPWRYQAPIAGADRSNLLAAFNSAFKLKDSQGGYYADGRLAHPMRDGGATLAIRTDGTPTVGQWGRDIQMGPDIAYARQNLSLIVDNGQPVADIDSGTNGKWGWTVGNKVQVWRSGIGVTANGALLYAGGNNLTAGSLARVLARAGAVRAMELDINSAWVDFFTYAPAAGQPPGSLSGAKLLPDMGSGPSRYLGANSRDFVAIFRR
jgi:hypothetical protein